ncbi:hypothetical protein ACLOJK_003750 [Asimina triloba]
MWVPLPPSKPPKLCPVKAAAEKKKKNQPPPSQIRSVEMKRPTHARDPTADDDDPTRLKKRKHEEEGEEAEEEAEVEAEAGFAHLDENLLFEVLKHADVRTLATAACVSKQWQRTAQDERLWEMICMRHWPNTGCGNQQLRCVVLALGGFRNLHAFYLRPLLKPQAASRPSIAPSSSSSTGPGSAGLAFPVIPGKAPARWLKDEVHLSLSLLSIQFYEKMNPIKRGR